MSIDNSTGGESMTGGVGTAFYRAPEQEGDIISTKKRSDRSYTVQADVFSLGIILFEMFHPPFLTYMERAATLTALRGERSSKDFAQSMATIPTLPKTEFEVLASKLFPKSFLDSVPENAQRCVETLLLS